MADSGVSPRPLRFELPADRTPDSCTLVIFGAFGDLARRKLMPALYNLLKDDQLPQSFAIVGVGRRENDAGALAKVLREGIEQHSRRPFERKLWSRIESRISYFRTTGKKSYRDLEQHLADEERRHKTGGNRLFYLAVPPSAFVGIVEGLAFARLQRPGQGGEWARIVVEKPIGTDLQSACELNHRINEVFDERDVYRIDHYLGKETVQNLLVFRFANAIFEPLWNHKYVDHVQITVAESIGVEGRGSYFEEAGITRDMVQNHLFQLLCLMAMEPPVSLNANAIRDEKVKVLQALRPVSAETAEQRSVRAQYAAGVIGDRSVTGYREEPGVAAESRTETYVALRLFVDNWRWANVPIYLRAGKRMPKRVTEISFHFHDVPHRLFRPEKKPRQDPNVLALQIQPDEGITLRFDAKVPGSSRKIRPVTMEFGYDTSFGDASPEAYERLLLDAILGDSTLFIRRDEVEASWAIIDQFERAWADGADSSPLPEYTAGTWGPAEADVLLARDGRVWRRL